jgi:hypothetical protein
MSSSPIQIRWQGWLSPTLLIDCGRKQPDGQQTRHPAAQSFSSVQLSAWAVSSPFQGEFNIGLAMHGGKDSL